MRFCMLLKVLHTSIIYYTSLHRLTVAYTGIVFVSFHLSPSSEGGVCDGVWRWDCVEELFFEGVKGVIE